MRTANQLNSRINLMQPREQVLFATGQFPSDANPAFPAAQTTLKE